MSHQPVQLEKKGYLDSSETGHDTPEGIYAAPPPFQLFASQGEDAPGQRRALSQDAPIQRLVKDSFPWTGVVVGTSLAALRSSPSKDPDDPHKNTVADIPKGHNVEVLGNSGNWLKVKTTLKGKSYSGYVSQELIDDAVAAELDGMLGEEATWVPSGPDSGNTFEKWATAPSEKEAPTLSPSTTINCWEVILYAAFQAGQIDWAWINNLYTNVSIGQWVSQMASGTTTYIPGKTTMNRGDLVFFNGLSHVAMATGAGDQIFTFWPPPEMESYVGTVDEVKVSTTQKLKDYMLKTWPGTPVDITFGPPAW